MNSLNFLFFVFQFVYMISADTQQFSQLEVRDVTLGNLTSMNTLERRKTSKPNPVACSAAHGPPIKADLKHCDKIATYLVDNKKTCGYFKTCVLMTRSGLNRPKRVKFYKESELRYYVQLMFSLACKVARPVNIRKKPPKPSEDDFLWLTPAFVIPPFEDEQVTECDKAMSRYMAAIPLPKE
ncbi:hypothetical protein DFH28DRAFT_985609 [Melampsora americana]|nr:hypothetical protein DFH28DRAFT_985609 [Melampsora americana]